MSDVSLRFTNTLNYNLSSNKTKKDVRQEQIRRLKHTSNQNNKLLKVLLETVLSMQKMMTIKFETNQEDQHRDTKPPESEPVKIVEDMPKCHLTQPKLNMGDVETMPNHLKFDIIEHIKSIAKDAFMKSDQLLAVDKYDYALDICETIEQKEDNHEHNQRHAKICAVLNMNVGVSYFKMDQFEMALDQFEKALDYDSEQEKAKDWYRKCLSKCSQDDNDLR